MLAKSRLRAKVGRMLVRALHLHGEDTALAGLWPTAGFLFDKYIGAFDIFEHRETL